MGRLALIGGHSILGSDPAAGFEPLRVETPSGSVMVHERGEQVLLQRHGLERYTTAAKVDHARNFAALAALGCDRALAIASVGGLRPELDVGTFLCPDDFIALHLGLSLDDQHGGERIPGFDAAWRTTVLGAWDRAAVPRLIDGGVYWQAIGPRFETPAEIRLIAAHADVIGMTIASEAIVAGEMEIPYAAVCVVDNLANGVAEHSLSVAEFEAGKVQNRKLLAPAIEAVAIELEGDGRPLMALVVEGAALAGEKVGVRIEDGLIAELGPEVTAAPGDEIVAGAGTAIVPGLVNGHTHAAMTLFRGYADDLPLMEWLQGHIWPAEAKLNAEDVYWGTRLACAEMIRTGTVRFWDMYWQPGAVARAVADAGLRATVGPPLIDGDDPEGLDALRRSAAEGLGELESADAELITPSLAPHAIYTVSTRSLEWIAEEADRLELPVQIHISETEGEVSDCLSAHGIRPIELLERVGLLGPRTLLAHAVWLDERERELIAASGATVVTNPVANMKLAVGGIFDLPAARRHGIPVGLGTDGAGSNNSLDLLADAKHLALGQKHRAGDAAASPAAETLAIATGRLAPLLGAAADGIKVGAPADLLLVRTDGHELGFGDLDAGLVYASSGSVVDTTIVAGNLLMSGGQMEDEAEIVAHARERAARLGLLR